MRCGTRIASTSKPGSPARLGASFGVVGVALALFAASSTAAPSTAHAQPAAAESTPANPAPAAASPAPSPKPADPADAPPTDPRVRPVEPGEGNPVPAAPDERTGHVYIRAGSALVLPSGSIRSEVAANAVVGPGAGFIGGIGVGLSRHAEIDLLATYALMRPAGGTGGGACTGCSGNHFSASLGFVYHLIEGAALDPWMRFGSGYRTAVYEGKSIQLDSLVPGRFHGWDIAQISLGATFFPALGFGFGPFFESDIGTYVQRPAGVTIAQAGNDNGSPRAYAFFQLGLRVEIDPVRWTKRSGTRSARATVPSF